jgi:integrase
VEGTAHNLRHTFGTMWTGSEFALKEILGHSNFEMLSKYRALRLETTGKLHKVHSPLVLIQNVGQS